MSRTDYLTIGIVALCIIALIYLVYRYVNLPHTPPSPNPSLEQIEENPQAREDTVAYPAEDTTIPPNSGAGAKVEPEPELEKVVTEPVKPVPSVQKPEPTLNKPAPTPANTAAAEPAVNSAGRYMVIAGSFKQASSAQTQLRKVQKLGYGNARIEKFNRGTYASVLVERFTSRSQAQALVNTLKRKGLDAMVLEKR
jgi:cell division protein FtsN